MRASLLLLLLLSAADHKFNKEHVCHSIQVSESTCTRSGQVQAVCVCVCAQKSLSVAGKCRAHTKAKQQH